MRDSRTESETEIIVSPLVLVLIPFAVHDFYILTLSLGTGCRSRQGTITLANREVHGSPMQVKVCCCGIPLVTRSSS